MLDIYLKAGTEQELATALSFARVKDEQGNDIWMPCTKEYALDLVGALYNDDAVLGEDGIVITPPTSVPGYHANLRLLDENLLSSIPESIIITEPNNPRRRFF